MNKKIIYSISFLIIVIFLIFLFLSIEEDETACTMEAKICSDGSSVGRVSPDCNFSLCPGEKEGILISLPKINEKIKSPVKIEGEAKGFWFFEAEFIVQLFDSNNNFLGETILTAQDEWMTEKFVPFKAELIFLEPSTSSGMLKFLNSNPSGLSEHQKIFEFLINF